MEFLTPYLHNDIKVIVLSTAEHRRAARGISRRGQPGLQGNLALPNHWKLPMDIPTMTLKLVSHKDRKVKFDVTLKKDGGKFKAGQTVPLVMDDNLESCKAEFDKVFGSSKEG